MTDLSDKILRHQRAELRAAERYRAASIIAQFVVSGFAASSVPVNDGGWLAVIAVGGVLAACASIWAHHHHRNHRAAGEGARRLLQIVYGLGWPVANAATYCSECQASTRKLSQMTALDYFATRARYGPRKLAEMIDESAFFTGRLHQRSATIMWVANAFSAGVIVVVWSLWGWRQSGDVQVIAVRLILTFAAFMLTSGALAAAFSHQRAAATMRDIRQRLPLRSGRGGQMGDVMQLMTDYNAAVEGAPLPTPKLYECLGGELNRDWARYKQATGIGRRMSLDTRLSCVLALLGRAR